MRERIDALRKERVVFDVIYRQLEIDIKSKREELISMMSKTDKAEKARDEARADLDRAQQEASRLKDLFSKEWNEVVERSLQEQNDVTLDGGATSGKPPGTQESMKTRTLASADKKERSHHETAGDSYAAKLRSMVARAAWSIARDTGYIHVSLQKVQQYEEALATVKEAIGMNATLQDVVERFQQTEAQNYSLYQYVSELNAESEQLTEEIRDLEVKIQRHRSYGMGNATQSDIQGKREQLEEIMGEVERT